jgi:hypothetical protein
MELQFNFQCVGCIKLLQSNKSLTRHQSTCALYDRWVEREYEHKQELEKMTSKYNLQFEYEKQNLINHYNLRLEYEKQNLINHYNLRFEQEKKNYNALRIT